MQRVYWLIFIFEFYVFYSFVISLMPWVKGAIRNFGHINPNGKGFRISAKIDGKQFHGPTRASRGLAKWDLEYARQCGSREQMCNFIKLLHNGHAREHLRGYQKILHTSSLKQCTAVMRGAKGKSVFAISNPF